MSAGLPLFWLGVIKGYFSDKQPPQEVRDAVDALYAEACAGAARNMTENNSPERRAKPLPPATTDKEIESTNPAPQDEPQGVEVDGVMLPPLTARGLGLLPDKDTGENEEKSQEAEDKDTGKDELEQSQPVLKFQTGYSTWSEAEDNTLIDLWAKKEPLDVIGSHIPRHNHYVIKERARVLWKKGKIESFYSYSGKSLNVPQHLYLEWCGQHPKALVDAALPLLDKRLEEAGVKGNWQTRRAAEWLPSTIEALPVADVAVKPSAPLPPLLGVPHEAPPKRYAWEGKIIKLVQPDYDDWKQEFPSINLDKQLAYWDNRCVENNVHDWWHIVKNGLRKYVKMQQDGRIPHDAPRH